MLLIIGCVQNYDYEVCEQINKDYSEMAQCHRVKINNIIQPSTQTEKICVPDFEEAKKFGAMSECEDVPVNRLLFKGGTNKTICNGYNAGGSTFTDNWWNAEGLIDNCEMPVNSNMQFIFKQHDQSIRSHTGVIQIKIDALNYNNYKALQIFTAEDSNNDNLPDNWKHCGNVDGIYGRSTKIIQCSGTNLKFIKLVNAEWNKGSLFIDNVEVLKI